MNGKINTKLEGLMTALTGHPRLLPLAINIAIVFGVTGAIFFIGNMDHAVNALQCGPNRMCGCVGRNMC